MAKKLRDNEISKALGTLLGWCIIVFAGVIVAGLAWKFIEWAF